MQGPSNFNFFSSRRRHTRSVCDWSSEVCSSDLGPPLTVIVRPTTTILSTRVWKERYNGDDRIVGRTITVNGGPSVVIGVRDGRGLPSTIDIWQIGRAWGRERG